MNQHVAVPLSWLRRLLRLAEETALSHEADKHESRGEHQLIEVQLLQQVRKVKPCLREPVVQVCGQCVKKGRCRSETPDRGQARRCLKDVGHEGEHLGAFGIRWGGDGVG